MVFPDRSIMLWGCINLIPMTLSMTPVKIRVLWDIIEDDPVGIMNGTPQHGSGMHPDRTLDHRVITTHLHKTRSFDTKLLQLYIEAL